MPTLYETVLCLNEESHLSQPALLSLAVLLCVRVCVWVGVWVWVFVGAWVRVLVSVCESFNSREIVRSGASVTGRFTDRLGTGCAHCVLK